MTRKKIETLEDLLADDSFVRWGSGEADEHTSFWEEWIKEKAERKELVDMALAILQGVPFQIRESALQSEAIQEAWQQVQAQSGKIRPGRRVRPEKKRLRVRTRRLRIAAGLAILIISGFLLEYFVFNPVISHNTPYGQQLAITLVDSTIIKLNANSTLTYRKRNPRKVWLDGEAFFQVKKKPATGANFLVLTNDLTVEVLGTAFNVIEKEDKTEVVLEEGSVRLNLNRDFERELLMEPGDQVTFSALSHDKVETRKVKAESITAWKDGVLEFDDVLLTEIMDRIEAIYGWKAVYYNESLKERKITLGLPSEDLESALMILSKSMGMTIDKVQREGKVLLLR